MINEGIGQGRVTSNLQGAPIDDAVFVHDTEALEMVNNNNQTQTNNNYMYTTT